MISMGMDRSRTNESHEMELGPFGFYLFDGLEENGIGEETSVLDGEGNTREVLINNPTGAHSHVAHLTISGSVPGKTNRNARGLEARHWVVAVKFFEGGEVGFADRVSGNSVGESPTIEHD